MHINNICTTKQKSYNKVFLIQNLYALLVNWNRLDDMKKFGKNNIDCYAFV